MKVIGYRTRMILVSLFAALFLMPTGWSPEPVLAQGGIPIGFGDNINRDVGGCSGETTTFNFQANANDVVFLRVLECLDFRIGCPFTVSTEPCVQLNDEAGNVITPRICTASEVLIRQKLPSDGTYSIIYRDDGAGSGRYNFFLQRVNNPGRVEDLVPGDDQLIFLNSCGEVDTYTFNARAGDRVMIDMVPAEIGNIDPRVELYDDSGRAIEVAGRSSIDRELTSSGTFTLLAYSSGAQTGSYRISLTIGMRTVNLPLVSAGQASEGVRRTAFVLVNTSDSRARGTLELFEPDGVTPLEVTIRGLKDSLFNLSIPAGGVQIMETEDTTPLVQGYARVTTDVPIRANVILRSVDEMGNVVFETIYGTPVPTRALTVPADSVGEDTDTGLVLLYPVIEGEDQPAEAEVTLRLVNQRGQPVGSPVILSVGLGQLSTGPNGEVIRFMSSDLFSTVEGIDEFEGTIVVTSSTGKPRRYYATGPHTAGRIFWEPVPDAAHTIRYYGLIAEAAYTARGNTFAYPDTVSPAFSQEAAKILRLGRDDSITDLQRQAAGSLGAALESCRRWWNDDVGARHYSDVHET